MTSWNPEPRDIEQYLGIRQGSLNHILHYALRGALVNKVRVERKHGGGKIFSLYQKPHEERLDK